MIINVNISTTDDTEKEADEYFLRKAIETALELLGDSPRDIQQIKVLKWHFGLLDDGKPHALRAMGKKFNLTGEGIRKIEKKALARLRKNQRVAELSQDFY